MRDDYTIVNGWLIFYNGYKWIVDDEDGKVFVFDTYLEAEAFAKEEH